MSNSEFAWIEARAWGAGALEGTGRTDKRTDGNSPRVIRKDANSISECHLESKFARCLHRIMVSNFS